MILLGFKNKIINKVHHLNGHLLIEKYSFGESYEAEAFPLTDSLSTVLRGFPNNIKHWQPYAMRYALLKTEDEVQGVIIKGIDQTYDTLNFRNQLIAGRMPNLTTGKYSLEVVLSKKIANYLSLQVNDKVMVYFVQDPPRFRKLKVVGIYETGLEDFDENLILGDIDLLRRMNGWQPDEIGGIEIIAGPNARIDELRDEVLHAISYELMVEVISDKYRQIFDWLKMLNRNVMILMCIILVVAILSMVSIILIMIMERTQMVGLLKSMGGKDSFIRKIFFSLGSRLILSGIIWGNTAALLLGFVQNRFKLIPLNPSSYYMNHVPMEFDWPTIVFVNITVITVVLLGIFIPLRFISKIDPIQSIRFD